jgi:cell wall-associated NlpC family hydrolase
MRRLQRPERVRQAWLWTGALALASQVALATPHDAPPVTPDGPPAHKTAASADPVLQLLQQRGLLPTAADLDNNRIVQQVRDAASEAVLAAMNYLGVPYQRGGNSADSGFDCSGFTRYIFEHSLGLLLPRRSEQQAHEAGLKNVAREELRPGDLVFFNTLRRAFSHVGIYIGEGRFIHSPRAGGVVRIEDMRQAYWAQRFDGARRADQRLLTEGAPAAGATPAKR